MEVQSKLLVNEQGRQINGRISAAIQEINNFGLDNIVLFLWNRESLKIDGNNNNQIYIGKESLDYPMPDSEVVTDMLLINQNKYLIVCLSDGQLFITKNNIQSFQNQNHIIIQQKQSDFYDGYCRIAFFQYENQKDRKQNKYYLLAVDYKNKISKYSFSSIENCQITNREKLANQYIFVQYDQINQVFLAMGSDLALYCFKMNDLNHNLEQFQIQFDKEDLKNLGIISVKDFIAFDFQYKDEKYQIYILGKLIGIFSVSMNDVEDNQNKLIAQITFLFDPFENEICKFCDRNYIQIFSDKRKEKFDSQEITVIYDKLALKFYNQEDQFLKIFDLKDFNADKNLKIDKYICLYGNSQNISYNIFNCSDCQNIEDSFKQISCDRIFINKEK
ncbi:hypothetical protein TTHERM_01207560 (macronuclear) [Tetrahymena thermophila SB210]|uniref:WD40-repeat-containing domain n=1 Tax=Tetrahymena thermophila (strain SB210) TaxID=312017 RepID=Q23YR5_TETTS|nr:hypothetical protein TTHERM_01207560 [Tetrahymena thermophila SB210]EAS01657.2 hypothetical protein TTHERM_01207560 [Tetrahymena thermophila SB210]|eukprot:XP_001021902.2 hypothetical protein TTHERM_01207560 [Tetrahymena thermophila SB210]